MQPRAPLPLAQIETDALIVGAGPVGLFQVFQLGLLDIRAHVVDSLPHAGGQPVELYPDKPIFDIPAVPMCTGRELAASLLEQIKPFGATMHLGQEVTQVERQGDGRFAVATSQGTSFLAKTLFIAAGVGAFQPRKLKLDGVERFERKQLFYSVDESTKVAGKHVIVLGGDEAAISHAVDFAGAQAASVTLVHRRDVLQAPDALMSRFNALREAGKVKFVVGQPTGYEERDGALAALHVTAPDATTQPLPLDAIYAFFGLSPKLGPIAGWGLAFERKQLVVNTETFATSEPGIFAVGDINTYPGKKKLIVCGFHECVLAAFGAAAIVFPDKAIPLQYTTTSPRLHKLLGYEPPAA